MLGQGSEITQPRKRSVLNWAVLIFAFIGWNSAAISQELIPAGATWKYWDQGIPSADWLQPDFDDSTWPSGPAQLGCGENDESTVMGRTESSHARTLCYFRHQFNMQTAEASDQLLLRSLIDDGAVFYLNGDEIYRANMPTGELKDDTRARSGHYGRPENRWDQVWLPKSLLKSGRLGRCRLPSQ